MSIINNKQTIHDPPSPRSPRPPAPAVSVTIIPFFILVILVSMYANYTRSSPFSREELHLLWSPAIEGIEAPLQKKNRAFMIIWFTVSNCFGHLPLTLGINEVSAELLPRGGFLLFHEHEERAVCENPFRATFPAIFRAVATTTPQSKSVKMNPLSFSEEKFEFQQSHWCQP